MTSSAWALGLLTAVNVLAFAAFAWDKYAAQRRLRRVPEARLLLIAFAGGALGALIAQQVFRHKTVKQPFRALLIVAAALNLVVAVVLLRR